MPTLGASVTLPSPLYTAATVPTDPTALALEIHDPAGAATILALADLDQLATGSFAYTFTPDLVGIYAFRWLADDVVPEASDGTIEVTSVFEPQTYASLDRAVALFETRPNASRLARLATGLHTATDELIEELHGRDFFRHPASGTETWSPALVDIDGPVLHVHRGILDLASVEISGEVLDPSKYVLEGSSPYSGVAPSEPAFHIRRLSGRWPTDPSKTVIDSGRGWPRIPSALAESCAARARQLTYGDASYTGSIPGPDEYAPVGYGSGFAADRWPQVFYRFLQRENTRFMACLFGNAQAAH